MRFIKEAPITKIEGQIAQEDYTKLVQELCRTTASVPTSIGGGKLGHIGLVLEDSEYKKLSGYMSFNCLTNPGACPVGRSNDTKVQVTDLAKHKLQVIVYEQVTGVDKCLCDLIEIAVPKEYLAAITNKYTGIVHLTIQEILGHVESKGTKVEDVDVAELNAKMNKTWTVTEAPVTYFVRQDEVKEQLEKAGIPKNTAL